MFNKNSKIIQLQTNFLRRLCDTQAGKVSKAIMIWKSLPEPQNKELIKRASIFQSNLSKYGDKIIRAVFNQFKDIHFVGNERKKIAIKKLVDKNCSGIEHYFSKWRENNKLTTLYRKTNLLEKIADNLTKIQQENYRYFIEGNRAELIRRKMAAFNNWLIEKEVLYLKKWRRQIHRLKELENVKKIKICELAALEKADKRKKAI